jgi:hypothetical protein
MAGKSIRGGPVKSLAALRKSVKRSTSGGAIQRVPKETPLTVRFLEEPDRWYEFFEHWDEGNKRGFICTGDDCKGCADDLRVSKRLLANVVDMDEGRVKALALPTSLANILLKKLDKFKTLLDRDYELAREGEGKGTEYDATPEAPTKFNARAYEPLDLEEVLQNEIDPDGEEDDDADDEFLPPKKRGPNSTRPVTSRSKYRDEDDEDEPPRRTIKRSLPVKKAAKTLAKPSGKGLRRN